MKNTLLCLSLVIGAAGWATAGSLEPVLPIQLRESAQVTYFEFLDDLRAEEYLGKVKLHHSRSVQQQRADRVGKLLRHFKSGLSTVAELNEAKLRYQQALLQTAEDQACLQWNQAILKAVTEDSFCEHQGAGEQPELNLRLPGWSQRVGIMD